MEEGCANLLSAPSSRGLCRASLARGVHWVVAQHLPAPIAFFIKHVVKRIVPSQRSGSICKMALRGESLTMVALASESFRGGGRVSTD